MLACSMPLYIVHTALLNFTLVYGSPSIYSITAIKECGCEARVAFPMTPVIFLFPTSNCTLVQIQFSLFPVVSHCVLSRLRPGNISCTFFLKSSHCIRQSSFFLLRRCSLSAAVTQNGFYLFYWSPRKVDSCFIWRQTKQKAGTKVQIQSGKHKGLQKQKRSLDV